MDKYKKESGLLDSREGLSKLLFDIKPLNKKPIELSFTSEKVSSDGGLLLLREVENQIGILSALTDCIDDTRHPGYIQHTLDSMLTQRVFQIAAGYEDANDSDTLRDDLILKICSGKAPDGHFCSKELMAWTESQRKVHYLTGLTGNKTLNSLVTITIESAKKQFKQTGIAVKRYHSFYYAAGSWHKPERVIVKVEVSSKGLNIRYIVTDIGFIRTKALYENAYCARGQMELYIKEHKTYLKSDKMSCSSFAANQFRLFLHSAAYVLIHTLRTEVLANTEYATASMKTIQLRLIKVAAYVKEMKTRIRIEFPKQFPDLNVIVNCLHKFELLRC